MPHLEMSINSENIATSTTGTEETAANEEEEEDAPYKQSLLDIVREAYEVNAHLRCTRVFYVGLIKNESHKQAILHVHREYISKQDSIQAQPITGALLFINNKYFFHVIEVDSFESTQILFKQLLTDDNIKSTNMSIAQQQSQSKKLNKLSQHSSRNQLRRSSVSRLQPNNFQMSRQISKVSTDASGDISNSQASMTATARQSSASLLNSSSSNAQLSQSQQMETLNNILVKETPITHSQIHCKICNITDEIVREFPIWSYRDVNIKSENSDSNKNSNDSGNSKNSGNSGDGKNNDGDEDTEDDIKNLTNQEPQLFSMITETITSMAEIGRQLTLKNNSTGALKLFSSMQREILTRFPKPDSLESFVNSKILFDLKDFYRFFFFPIKVELESEHTWPVDPIMKF